MRTRRAPRFAVPLALWLAAAAAAQAEAGLELSLDAPDPRWHGVAAVAEGVRGGAARFAGDAAHLDAGPCPVPGDRSFTLRCSLRTRQAGFATVLMARAGEQVGLSLVLGRQPGILSFEAWSWTRVRLPSRQRVDDGRWHEVEVDYDAATRTAVLLVDGAVQASAELGPGGAPAAVLRLGNNLGAHQPYHGDLDEVSLRPGVARPDLLAAAAPVLPLAERRAALQALRARLLPEQTPSLAAAAAAAWPARRAAVRAHVQDALGLAPPPARAPLDVQVHGELVRDGVRLQRLSWSGFPGQRATGWLWSPAAPAAGRRPAVLCPHGHWPHGARDPVVQARCAAFAQFGWLALAVDSVHVEDVASGVNSVGAMTWHNQRALDLLLGRDDVDPARVAATGASGGGQQTYYLMALEDRLAAAAPMVMACYFAAIVADDSAHCGCNHVPRLAARTDVPELCAVFAPRPAMFGSVTGDWTRDFPQRGRPELAAHWQRLGGAAPRARHADEGHNYDRPMREAVYGFLHDALLGAAADGAPRQRVAEPPFAPFAQAELAPLLAAAPAAAPDRAALAAEFLARRAAVEGLADLAPGLDLRVTPRPLQPRADGPGPWRRAVLTAEDGVPLPLRLGGGPATAPFALVVDPHGMAAAATGPLPADRRVVLVDPRPYGEWAPFRAAWQRNGILLGRGEAYRAALDVALVAASLPGDAPVEVHGRGEAAAVAVLAAHLCARAVAVVGDLGPRYAADGNRLPLAPELRRFADLPELAARLGPRCRRGD